MGVVPENFAYDVKVRYILRTYVPYVRRNQYIEIPIPTPAKPVISLWVAGIYPIPIPVEK